MSELERFISQRLTAVLCLPEDLRQPFEDYVELVKQKMGVRKQKKLVSTLNSHVPQLTFPNNPQRYVFNLSSVILTQTQLNVLSLGPKFCIPCKKIDQAALEVQFESLIAQTKDLLPTSSSDVENLKSSLVHSCHEYVKTKPSSNSIITREQIQSLKELRLNNELIISKPDKGSGIVLMDRVDYIHKMQHILSDESKFQRLMTGKDNTGELEKQLTGCLRRMMQAKLITKKEFEKLKPSGGHLPRLYGLPKVHKEGAPMRPILDMVGSPQHLLAQWMVAKLQPLRNLVCTYCVRDTFEFIERISESNLVNKRMISFDAQSLFTNIPLLETVDYVCELARQLPIYTTFPETLLKEVLLRCTLNVQFTFNGEMYRQIDGVAMGSPLGPLLADIFMAKLEHGPLATHIRETEMYVRYVDDTFVLCKSEKHAEQLLKAFNDAHKNLHFTCEHELGNRLPFLDVEVIRNSDGSCSRKVHRKHTWTGQYTNFHSAVPLQHKRSLIRSLAFRARSICTPDTVNEELQRISDTLRENGYPDKFIMKHLKERNRKPPRSIAPKKELFIHIPFKGDSAADLLSRRLKDAVEKTYFAARLRIVFHNNPLLTKPLKDRLPPLTRSMIIYQYSCSCGAQYVGRTTRRLSQRVREHIPAWFYRGEMRSSDSSIMSHLLECGHTASENDFKVIYSLPEHFSQGFRKQLLSIAEAMYIHHLKPELCVQKRFIRPILLPWPTDTVT
ncbi:unnamed protein product [Dicrocoelium dendriticum]|nr:unnamed protein product [Dicrocoelium dendriticum]